MSTSSCFFWKLSGNTVSKKRKTRVLFNTWATDGCHIVLIDILWSPLQPHEAHGWLAEIRRTKLWVFSKGKQWEMGVCQPQSRNRNHYSLLSESIGRWPNRVCGEWDWAQMMQLQCYLAVNTEVLRKIDKRRQRGRSLAILLWFASELLPWHCKI